MTEAVLLNFWWSLLLIFARIAAFLATVPIFAWRGIPVILRIFTAFVLSVLLALSREGEVAFPATDFELLLLLGKELLTGLVLGFLVYLFLSVFLMAGQFMDHQAGLMMAGAFDPLFGSQVTLLGQFFYFLGIVFYLTINGHHMLFLALKNSFTAVPLTGSMISTPAAWHFLKIFSSLFLIAFQIAAPVIIVLWLTDLALGFLSRVVPQIHVFIVGLPLKIAFVLLIFLLLLPQIGSLMRDLFALLEKDLLLILENW
ncbi:MAG: flagellar biosynthetic protein FliR [Firmicutes bacterium]|nr:flagellar biosynthetic protein FliR [Bacillota bacterium]